MVQIDITYTGNLKCSAVHKPSGTTLISAAPKDNQGDGSSFSPTDLLATSLGTCMMTLMGIAARKHEIDLEGTTIRVEKNMSDTPPRRVAKLVVTISVNKVVAPEFHQRLENAAMTCPVHKSLSHEMQIPVTFHWKD